jgi:hypothetical protein
MLGDFFHHNSSGYPVRQVPESSHPGVRILQPAADDLTQPDPQVQRHLQHPAKARRFPLKEKMASGSDPTIKSCSAVKKYMQQSSAFVKSPIFLHYIKAF